MTPSEGRLLEFKLRTTVKEVTLTPTAALRCDKAGMS